MLERVSKGMTVMMTISVCRPSTVDSSPSAAGLVLGAGEEGVQESGSGGGGAEEITFGEEEE